MLDVVVTLGMMITKIPDNEKVLICAQIGILTKFIWSNIKDMQMFAYKPPMNNTSSRKAFTDKLSSYSLTKDVAFEDITLSLMTPHSTPMNTKLYKDEMNSKMYCFLKPEH